MAISWPGKNYWNNSHLVLWYININWLQITGSTKPIQCKRIYINIRRDMSPNIWLECSYIGDLQLINIDFISVWYALFTARLRCACMVSHCSLWNIRKLLNTYWSISISPVDSYEEGPRKSQMGDTPVFRIVGGSSDQTPTDHTNNVYSKVSVIIADLFKVMTCKHKAM